ncbi:MAG: CotH kinase family protein, partial [Planctomycetes bacterium]|nr:CotH kinase family protein [Planctomycetota bacterium]
TWPAPTDALGNQGSNVLYQVDNSVYSGTQPIYRIIVPATEWTQWTALMSNSTGAHSAVAMNGTFLSVDGGGTEVRYLSSFGNRGEGTRHAVPHNIEAMFPSDHPWNGMTRVGFNTRTTYSQAAGNAIFEMAGLPANYGTPVQMRVNGNNLANQTPTGGADTYQYGSYFMFEPYDTEWADQYFPEDSGGNIYKGVMTGSTPADFSYRGINPASYSGTYVAPYGLNGGYSKQTNGSANDWSDLIHLTDVLNNTPDATYAQAVSQVINVDEWMKYFAINSLVGNRENSLGGLGSYGTLVADDYSMYSGVLDPRFQLLVHDMDTVLGEGDYDTGWANTPFQFEAADCQAIERLLKSQDFAPLYYAAFKEQIETTFSAAVINPLLDEVLGGWIPNNVIQSMKDYAANRAAYVLSQIPLTLTAASALTQQSNYPRSTTATTTVTGTANAIDTRRILVNGVEATYTAWTGAWSATNVTLRPGINRVLVQALGVGNVEVGRTFIDIWYDTLATRAVSGTLPVGTTTWTAGNPYQVSGTLTIPAGATLIIQPGVTVFFDAGAKLLVNGRLDAQGTSDLNRIRFTKTPAAASNWAGIEFNYTSYSSQVNRISYADIEYSDSGSYAIKCVDGQVVLDHIRFARHNKQYLTFDDSSLILRDSYLSDITGAELFHFWGMPATGYAIIEGNFFGKTTGYNDIIDLTGGNRPGPIAQFINNTFSGGGDDCIDLDGTDAQVEGNIFYNIKTDDPGRESQSHAVTTGTEGGLYS